MFRTFALVSVVAALAVAGCGKSESTSAVAIKPPVNVVPAVKQETATIEAPLENPAEATAAATVDTAVKPAAATIEAPLDKLADATAIAPADEAADEKLAGIGDQGPAWENLAGTDDMQHSLKDLAEAKAVAATKARALSRLPPSTATPWRK